MPVCKRCKGQKNTKHHHRDPAGKIEASTRKMTLLLQQKQENRLVGIFIK